jgi:hypothetical protein
MLSHYIYFFTSKYNMAFSFDDITFYLSGGSANNDPNLSLGGDISITPLPDGVDALFSQVSLTQASQGNIVYRCIYVVNEGDTLLSNFTIWQDNQEEISSEVDIGISVVNEVQKIILAGNPIGGTFTLIFDSQTTDDIQWVPTPSTMANNIANALNSLSSLTGISVSSAFTTRWEYSVTFGGADGKRNQPELQIGSNNILGTGISLSVSTTSIGQPINASAPNIGFENQAPNGIIFTSSTTKETGINIGILEPSDLFAIWLRRTVESGINATIDEIDSVEIKFFATVNE